MLLLYTVPPRYIIYPEQMFKKTTAGNTLSVDISFRVIVFMSFAIIESYTIRVYVHYIDHIRYSFCYLSDLQHSLLNSCGVVEVSMRVIFYNLNTGQYNIFYTL